MLKPLILSLVGSLAILSAPASAQQNIPDVVIDQCNDSADASDLPDCLKEGALGHEMISLAQEDAYYGAAATPVAEICLDINDSFETSWICLRQAFANAAETHKLIGVENIKDACVAGISDPATYDRITQYYQKRRETVFPDEMFGGMNVFHSFKGCN